MSRASKRKARGEVIATARKAVRKIDEFRYFVKSQSGNNKYEVRLTDIGWVCSCNDHKFRGVNCKHIYAVECSFPVRQTVKQELIIQPISQFTCRYCNSDIHIGYIILFMTQTEAL